MKSTAHFRPLAATLLLLALALAGPVSAATLTWNGGNGSWNDPTKWSPMQIPGAGDTAVIGGTDELAIVLSGIRSVGTLVLNNPNATLQVVGQAGASATLTVANGFGNGGIIELTSVNTSGGATLTVSNGGTLTNATSGVIRVLEGSGGTRTLNAFLDNRGTLEAGADLTLTRNIANSGTVRLPEGRSATANSPITWTHQGGAITGTGTLSLGSGSTLALEADFTTGSYSFNAAGLTVNGPGTLLGPPTGEFVIRQWTINAPMTVSGDLRVERNVAINSALAMSPGRTLRVVGQVGAFATLTVANGFENRGIIELTSANTSGGATMVVTTGTLTNAVGGVIRALDGSGGTRVLNADLDNQGEISVLAGVTLTMNRTLLNAATGVLSGTGTFNLASATVTNKGAVAPGASPGRLSISGSYPWTAAAQLDLELGGFTAGTEHDQLALANAANLDGVIRVALINGFFPKKDDAFTVLTYPSRTGTFATLDNPLPKRIAWEVRYGPTSAQLVVLNTAPTLAAIPKQTLNELAQLSVTASATDQDLPAQIMTYTLETAPTGMTINPATGQITWTPTEAQGPGEFDVTVRVTDNGTPTLGHAVSFKVTVNEVNVAPQLVLPAPVIADEQAELVFTINSTDADLPVNALTYEMVSGPPGATFNATTREFRWTPTEAQGPGSFTATFRVTDNNPDALNEKQLSSQAGVSLAVAEVNLRPTLADIAPQTVNEETLLTLTASVTDLDLPANGLTYSLDAAPTGLTINPATGQISWTPTEAQGPGTFTVSVRVTDTSADAVNEKSLSGTGEFQIAVAEVNRAPVPADLAGASVHAGTPFTASLTATDPDLPANPFTFSLISSPTGMAVSPGGSVSWNVPLEAAGSLAEFTVRVTDAGSPAASSERRYQVNVAGPIVILGAAKSGDQLEITWRAVPGKRYRLIRAVTLPILEWLPVPGEVLATGETASKNLGIDSTQPSSFLRVELVP